MNGVLRKRAPARRLRWGSSGTWLPYFSLDYLRGAWSRLLVRPPLEGEPRPPLTPRWGSDSFKRAA